MRNQVERESVKPPCTTAKAKRNNDGLMESCADTYGDIVQLVAMEVIRLAAQGILEAKAEKENSGGLNDKPASKAG